jgi:hypothetical protein
LRKGESLILPGKEREEEEGGMVGTDRAHWQRERERRGRGGQRERERERERERKTETERETERGQERVVWPIRSQPE